MRTQRPPPSIHDLLDRFLLPPVSSASFSWSTSEGSGSRRFLPRRRGGSEGGWGGDAYAPCCACWAPYPWGGAKPHSSSRMLCVLEMWFGSDSLAMRHSWRGPSCGIVHRTISRPVASSAAVCSSGGTISAWHVTKCSPLCPLRQYPGHLLPPAGHRNSGSSRDPLYAAPAAGTLRDGPAWGCWCPPYEGCWVKDAMGACEARLAGGAGVSPG